VSRLKDGVRFALVSAAGALKMRVDIRHVAHA
jgi:hypothetical protein